MTGLPAGFPACSTWSSWSSETFRRKVSNGSRGGKAQTRLGSVYAARSNFVSVVSNAPRPPPSFRKLRRHANGRVQEVALPLRPEAPADSRPLLRGRRALRHRRLGQGVLLDLRRRPPPRPPDAGGAPLRRPEGRRRRGGRPRHHAADDHPLPADPHLVREGAERGVREGDQGVRLRRNATAASFRSRSTRRRSSSTRSSRPAASTATASRRGASPSCIAALSQDLGPECLITTNGYKDEAFIRLALDGVRMGRNVILILEKVSELERILDVAKKRGVRPLVGMRAKLYARGSGKWAKSGGEAAKFGLTTTGDARGDRDPQGEADARLPRHAPLPHRLADHRHPQDQGRDPRGRARLREADPLGRRGRGT